MDKTKRYLSVAFVAVLAIVIVVSLIGMILLKKKPVILQGQIEATEIRISTRRLESFLAGKADLRLLYLQPENEHEYYDVVFQSGEYQKTLLKESVLLEDKLPAEGYVLSGEKRENVVINLPIKDRSLLAELVRKFGWACM